MTIEVERVASGAALEEALAIRLAVFVAEQGIPREVEIDAHDVPSACIHLLARVAGQPAGTLRVRMVDGAAKIERVAVRAEHRRRGVGLALMRRALAVAGDRPVRLHAQPDAAGFYERLGFRTIGGVFMEDGIPHVAMTLLR
jgi:predicted GNAT family N-acyltransferase